MLLRKLIMKEAEIENIERTETTKTEVIELLEGNKISYKLTECCGCERICIALNEASPLNEYRCNSAITVLTCSKNVCKIYPHEILYIAIENRKSVLYLTDRKIETYYPIDHWKSALNKKVFAQPHYSYIVNLNYVEEVTKDFVIIRYDKKEYSVYTSLRKIGSFKKAFLNFKG